MCISESYLYSSISSSSDSWNQSKDEWREDEKHRILGELLNEGKRVTSFHVMTSVPAIMCKEQPA